MKGRENRGPPTDLLVCFPSRAHLSLLPKRICSPARLPESSALPRHRRRLSGHHPRNSPQLWARSKQNHNNNAENSEPSSPKVTCAGQIKVRTKPNSCKNWQSVMEEIERLHKKSKKKGAWIEAFGFKKDVMQFLTCLRNIRFDFRCFGAVPASDVEDEDEDEDEDENEDDRGEDSGDVFSKWFTILQEEKVIRPCRDDDEAPAPAPPPNALLLMRCRSASWLEEKEEGETDLCEVSCEIGKVMSRSRSWRR